jgi:uncharacterized protein YggE
MSIDTISVLITQETELQADSAELTLVVEGSSLLFGDEALKKAKELQGLLTLLKQIGITDQQIKLRDVSVSSQGFGMIKSSSARYSVSVKKVDVALLSRVLGAVSGYKGAKLSKINWNYSQLAETRKELRKVALAEAVVQAQADAAQLNVRVISIHKLTEIAPHESYNPEYVTGDSSILMELGDNISDLGFQLTNTTTARIKLQAEFRVEPL